MKSLHKHIQWTRLLLGGSSIRRSFTIFMLLATLLPLSIVGITSYTISRQMIQDDISDFNESWIQKQKDYMELLLQNIDSMVDNIANLDSIKNVLDHKNSTSVDDYTNLSTQATIGYILSGYNTEGLVSIDLFSMGGAHYHVGETLNFQKINTKTKEKLFKLASESSGSVVWEGIEENINENSMERKVISGVRLITKIDSESLEEMTVGLLIISYDLDTFYKHFAQNSLNRNSTLIIVEPEREILFHPDKSKIGVKLNQDFYSELSGENGDFKKNIDGQEMFVVYSNSEKYKWTVLSYIPVNKLTEHARPIIYYALSTALLCLALISAYALNLSKRVLKPINQMTQTFQEIDNGRADLTQRLEVGSHDEIGELVKWFNAFMQNLHDKRDVEERLKRANEELETRVRERTMEIQDALEKLKATQYQLIQREKLAGIGQLAAGIAHEINNPLGYVTSNMASLESYIEHFKELLEKYRKVGSVLEDGQNGSILPVLEEIKEYERAYDMDYILGDLEELFADMNGGLDRVSKIVKSLRMFSWSERDAHFESSYDLNKGIENSLLIAQNEIKYVASVEQELGDIPNIEAIGSEINQVLLNILVNGTQAIKMKEMDKPGRIRIRTWNDNDFVYCTIEDDGVGISSEYLNQIFNPFFTTKPVGVGTGLGLSISYDIIVNQHHGQIIGESEIGKGTTFKIILPIRQKKSKGGGKDGQTGEDPIDR